MLHLERWKANLSYKRDSQQERILQNFVAFILWIKIEWENVKEFGNNSIVMDTS